MDMLIKHFKHFLVITICCLLVFHLTANANESDFTLKVKRGNGLLLLDVQVDAPSAVMTLQGVKSRQLVIKLAPTHGRWLVSSLPKGEYQIMNVKVPYFDLPYVNSTEKDPRWRIKIEPGQLNYIGRIEVERERTENYVAIRKHNRLVADLSHIRKDLADILADYPLTDGGYLRDDFIEQLLNGGLSHD
ncbi:hypothetical protein [Cellvibrio sp. PSBB006]|uniref:hypothetical protein n=1 Tax=Cellvibrio sp. PSBB006 TaxID=1987723 RepID=UPI000B3B6B84|nr:hypothetical protein [Cellvibrio sp. PSBB006]ARU28208.1 hypothetical protein CBR65_12655 [Cellvibrio sp. PSBB006]